MTHKLTELQRIHAGEVLAQINALDQENLKLEGQIRRNEREQSFMRRHLSLFAGQVAEGAGLPTGAGTTLSADGAELITKDEPPMAAPPATIPEGANNGLAS